MKTKTLADGLTAGAWDDYLQEVTFALDIRARGLADGRTVVRARFGTAREPHSTVYDIGDQDRGASIVGALRMLADEIDAEEQRRERDFVRVRRAAK